MIELKALSKAYGGSHVKAVDGLGLTVKDGEIFGFLGPNGAGKTTTIKMLTGILRPDEGEIFIDGVSLAKEHLEAQRKIGYVADNPELFVRLKAAEYLNFVADVYGVPNAQRQEVVSRYAKLFEIDSVLNARISAYSQGMKQKLMALASLIHDPHNWVLDEPLTGLDPSAAFHFKELMKERAAAGKTVFFSTHIMEVAENLCDRIGIIKAGKIIYAGTVEELRSRRGQDESLETLFLELVDKGAVS